MKDLIEYINESSSKTFANVKREIIRVLGLKPKDIGNSPNNKAPKFRLQHIGKNAHNFYAKFFDKNKITILLNAFHATPEEFDSVIRNNLDKLNEIEDLTYDIVDAKKYEEMSGKHLDSDETEEFNAVPDILIYVTK